MNRYIEVAIDNAALTFDSLYTYSVPEHLAEYCRVGARVLVPFGRSNAPRMGIILRTSSETDAEKVKEVIDAEKGELALTEDLVKTVGFLKDRTLCTYSDAIHAVLPKNSRMRSTGKGISRLSESHLENAYRAADPLPDVKLTKKQQALLAAIGVDCLTYAEIRERTGASRDLIKRLTESGALLSVRRDRDLEIYAGAKPEYAVISLTPHQQKAYDEILHYAQSGSGHDTTLLFGVTSSGKTLIYLSLIRKAVEEGRGAILLLPEITLATQMIYRLRAVFGDQVAIIHSGLSDAERQIQWQKIRSGECPVVVGTRSAVFAPVPKIAYIIIDEEQETTYCSEQSPRYSAPSVAAFRAKLHGAHLILSSATPSVETFRLAQEGKINLVRLTERYRQMPLPEVHVVDMNSELLAGNSLTVSKYLKDRMDGCLSRGEQCLLLLNRRGYRTVSSCRSCRTIMRCKSCDAALVYHKSTNTHVCHYCGYTQPVITVCPECGGEIKHTGIGTQKIEEELGLLFPNARIARMDVDSVSRKYSAEEILRDFGAGKYDILVGTQMIAKGLDFPNVTLVGVLSIDQLLLMPSYLATERTFSMLTQVVGRSGRGKRGEAVIQTIDPQNPVIRLAADQDYEGYYRLEILSRKLHLYPPFCTICTVGFMSRNEGLAEKAADEFTLLISRIMKEAYPGEPIRILGPAPMRVAYISETYRFRLILKLRRGKAGRGLVRRCCDEYNGCKHKDVSFYADFNASADI